MLKEISEKLNGFIGEETGLSRNKSFSANMRLAEELERR